MSPIRNGNHTATTAYLPNDVYKRLVLHVRKVSDRQRDEGVKKNNRLSQNTFMVRAIEEALEKYGEPEKPEPTRAEQYDDDLRV